MKITVWYRLTENHEWGHSHIETGHVTSSVPTPKVEAHKKLWENCVWLAAHAELIDNKIVNENQIAKVFVEHGYSKRDRSCAKRK